MNTEITLKTKLRTDPSVVFNEMDGEIIMMSIANGEFYGINALGSRIWQMLETPKAVSEICDGLMSDFDVTREQCEQDVLLFLTRMVEKGVMTVAD